MNTIEGKINTPGNYQVMIKVTDEAGNNDTASFWIKVLPDDNDIDGDGIPDLYEMEHGLDMNISSDASLDQDSDGLSNLEEFINHTNPNNNDTDDDDMPDGWEVLYGLDPLKENSNEDKDGDGISNYKEFLASTDPTKSDLKENTSIFPFVIIAIALLAILIIAVAVFFILKRKGAKKDIKVPQEIKENPSLESTTPITSTTPTNVTVDEIDENPFQKAETLRGIANSKNISIAHLEIQYKYLMSMKNNPSFMDQASKQINSYNKNIESLIQKADASTPPAPSIPGSTESK
jgi:hypothetical protein